MLQQEIENGKLLVEKASAGDTVAVKYLLDCGVRVNAEAYNQSLYYKSKNYLSPLHVAASNGHSEIVQMLIDANAELDIRDMFAVTPVHLAAKNGSTVCLRLLLEAGASCNLGTAFKRPQWVSSTVYPYVSDTRPLHLAAKNNHIDCIVELMMNGADYNAVDGVGRTSMYIAAEVGHENAVLAHLSNAYGKPILSLPMMETDDTPLHHCVHHNMKRAVLELVIHGSDVNFRNKLGMSSLHLALQNCSQTSFDVVHALVTKGYNTNINIPDGHGLTPLEYVSFRGFKQDRRPVLAAFLIAYGASFHSVKNTRGLSLLQHELGRGTKDYIILRAIVKTLARLPSLSSLGVSTEVAHRFFPPPPSSDTIGAKDDMEQFIDRCNWYQNLASSPRSLQHHCRCTVRKRLGPERLRHVGLLPLPVTLRDYLLLEYDEYR